eukprot:Sdes_comp9906_c0_seq1m1447
MKANLTFRPDDALGVARGFCRVLLFQISLHSPDVLAGSKPPLSRISQHAVASTPKQPPPQPSPTLPTPAVHLGFASARPAETLARVTSSAEQGQPQPAAAPVLPQQLSHLSKETKVPTSKYGRMFRYGALGLGLGVGAVGNVVRRSVGLEEGRGGGSGSVFLTEANAERLVRTLCRMRGAALKLGQMLSIQDEGLLPAEVVDIFERVRKGADFMPASQMLRILRSELGQDWRAKVATFEERPIAAASIGQVHQATLLDGTQVAMKVQYPGIAESIDSDIENLLTLLRFTNALPKGIFIEKTMENAKRELKWETDYLREAKCQKKFIQLLRNDAVFYVPQVIDALSSRGVLTSEMISGISVDKLVDFDQNVRDFVSLHVLRLCLQELFQFNFMQTDPNWANFFYDPQRRKIGLLDFGASRYFDAKFTDSYICVIKSAAEQNFQAVIDHSITLGFLTGLESKNMMKAHADAVFVLGEPFSRDEPYDFSNQNVTQRIHSLIPTMLKHRLTPPPDESYSLHRKLAGAFLLAAKLKAKINCKRIFDPIHSSYDFRRDILVDI